jgi:pimeloyl-ACP methyl ester carboxylesterase
MTVSKGPDPEPTIRRWFGDKATPEAEACRAWLSTVSPQGYKKAYTVFANEDGPSAQDLAKLDKPALFMTGALDPNSTPAMSTKMATACSDGQAVIIDDAAHMMPMTHCDLVNEHLISFIKSCFNAAKN